MATPPSFLTQLMVRNPPNEEKSLSNNVELSAQNVKGRKSRQEVDANDILPANASRSRTNSEKQKHINEHAQAINLKKIKQLERKLAKYKSQKSQKNKKVIESDSDNDAGSRDGHRSQAEVESEDSEDDDEFVTPFHSKGVVESSAPKKNKLKRLSEKSPKQVTQRSDVHMRSHASSSAGSLPPASSPSIRASRSSSCRSQRSPSPMSLSKDPSISAANATGRNEAHKTRPRSSYYYEEIRSRSPSSGLKQQPQSTEDGTMALDHPSEAGHRRGRSLSPKGLSIEHAPRKKLRADSPHISNMHNTYPRYEIMEYVGGKLPEKGKPKDSDYARSCRNLIKLAVKKYLLHIYTEHAFPDEETATLWASGAWLKVCKDVDKTFSPQDNDRVHSLLISRASSARGHLRDEIRRFVMAFFDLKAETSKKKNRDENIKTVKYVMEGAPPRFCYKDYKRADPRGYAEMRFPLQALQAHLFKTQDDLGSENSAAFNPLPLPTLALMLTIIEFCLLAWADGHYNGSLKLEDKHYRSKYDAHLAQLQDYQKVNPPVFTKIRKRMFERICDMSKAVIATTAIKNGISEEAQSRAKAELENRTGDTDSEAEERVLAASPADI